MPWTDTGTVNVMRTAEAGLHRIRFQWKSGASGAILNMPDPINGVLDHFRSTERDGSSTYDIYVHSNLDVDGTLTNDTVQVCRIVTGIYTGDGAVSQAITGVGFQPKYLRIWVTDAGAGDTYVFEKSDQHTTTLDTVFSCAATDEVQTADNQIIALGADGFTVDDAGVDAHPNKTLQAYHYLALG